jgi:hypothetical protein
MILSHHLQRTSGDIPGRLYPASMVGSIVLASEVSHLLLIPTSKPMGKSNVRKIAYVIGDKRAVLAAWRLRQG